MATVEADVSTEKSIAELRSIRRQIIFTNFMASMTVGLLSVSINRDLMGVAVFFVMIAACVCLSLR